MALQATKPEYCNTRFIANFRLPDSLTRVDYDRPVQSVTNFKLDVWIPDSEFQSLIIGCSGIQSLDSEVQTNELTT